MKEQYGMQGLNDLVQPVTFGVFPDSHPEQTNLSWINIKAAPVSTLKITYCMSNDSLWKEETDLKRLSAH